MSDLDLVVATYKRIATKLLQDPDDAEQLSNQFTILTGRGHRTPAHLALASRCAAVAPKEFIAIFNLGSAEMRAGLYEECKFTFLRALTLAPPDRRGITLQHIGMACHDLGEYGKALDWYAKAAAVMPDDMDLQQSTAIAWLAQGDLARGLFEFEVRLHKAPRKPVASSGIPFWTGQDLTGKTVLIGHEQGFGDTLNFIRFAGLLRKRGAARLVFSGPPALTGLIEENCDFDEVIGEDGPFEADFYTAPLSMAGVLGVNYASIDGQPYMKAEPFKLPKRGKLNVGLAWKGSPGYMRDADRSATLAALCPLFDLPGVAFYSLNVGSGNEEITKLGLDGFIGDLTGLIKDWRDTARAIAAMDVIVCVDTANGHMAGALGKPTFVMLSRAACWRWRSDESSTPWYQNHRLFRQRVANDWSHPVSHVRESLREMM